MHDDRRRGLFCPDHPDVKASSKFTVQFGRKVRRRFKEFRLAERFLDGLRYEVDRGTFDERDYKASNPLGFRNQGEQWLIIKENEVKYGQFKNIRSTINKAIGYWGDRNVKTIQYADFEDFFNSLKISNKSKSNARSILHTFWKWMLKRKVIKHDQFPEFPEISYELNFRKTISKEEQERILYEISRISSKENTKIWLGIKMLSTYISIRPNELISIQEKHIDLKNGLILIPHPKEKRPKLVPLIDEDIYLLSQYPKGLPDLYFFRHTTGKGGVKKGDKFGQRYLYKWWKKACSNLGIEKVDLYGGTRHSTTIALTEYATPEEIRGATMHTTNRAFERYYRVQKTDLKQLYSKTREFHKDDVQTGGSIHSISSK